MKFLKFRKLSKILSLLITDKISKKKNPTKNEISEISLENNGNFFHLKMTSRRCWGFGLDFDGRLQKRVWGHGNEIKNSCHGFYCWYL